MSWSIEKQLELYELFLSAKGSDNTDYIKEQLDKMYSSIVENNIGLGDAKMNFTMIYDTKNKTINGLSREEYEFLLMSILNYQQGDKKFRGDLFDKLLYLADKCREEFK